MSLPVLDRTVLPPEESFDALVNLVERASPAQSAELIGSDGTRITLPAQIYEVLRQVVRAMSRGQAVTVAPHNQRLTTQEAADLLGVSRPTLVKMLNDGVIPFEQPGRHRRVLLRDVLAYQQRRRTDQQAGLDELVEISELKDGYNKIGTSEPAK